MKKSLAVVGVALLLASPLAVAHSQEREMEKGPRAERGPTGMPGGPMGIRGMMRPGQRRVRMELLRDNPKLAGLMMQMRGEMMRIRGEELSKIGDVLRRYGERLEKEGAK